MPYLIGHATKATSSITNSSGLTLTIPHLTGAYIRLRNLLILNGSSILAINDNVSISNMSQDTPVNVPLTQLTLKTITPCSQQHKVLTW